MIHCPWSFRYESNCKHWYSFKTLLQLRLDIFFVVLVYSIYGSDWNEEVLCHSFSFLVKLLEWTNHQVLVGPGVPPWLLAIFQSVVLELLFLLLFGANDKDCHCIALFDVSVLYIRSGFHVILWLRTNLSQSVHLLINISKKYQKNPMRIRHMPIILLKWKIAIIGPKLAKIGQLWPNYQK